MHNASINKLKELIREYVKEALTLKRSVTDDLLLVVSDHEDPKSRSTETFRNKTALKNAGFKWDPNVNSWTIPKNKLDIAKQTLSKLNKVEYIVDKVEDLAEFIMDADNVSRKDLLSQKIEKYINTLTSDLDQTSSSAEIQNFFAFQSKIKNRSFYNTMLIYLQNRNATHVEGFRTWQEKFGRKVKKGATSIGIFAPFSRKQDVEDINNPDIDNQIKRKNHTWFRLVNVFDVADTEPISGKEHMYVKEPNWHSDNTPNEKTEKLYNCVIKIADEFGIQVERNTSKRGEAGYAKGDYISIDNTIDGINKTGTLIHEIAHELLHFKETSIFHIDTENLTKQDKEIQAEAVTYIVLKHYDLPTTNQSTYLALWKTSKTSLTKNLDSIKKVADFIIQKIDELAKN